MVIAGTFSLGEGGGCFCMWSLGLEKHPAFWEKDSVHFKDYSAFVNTQSFSI